MKIISRIVVGVLLLTMIFSVAVAAAGHSSTEVIFSENSALTDSKKEAVAAALRGDGSVAGTNSFTCRFLGHKYQTETVMAITHKAFAIVPRCLEEIYEVNICQRCDEREVTLLTDDRIFCCPAD